MNLVDFRGRAAKARPAPACTGVLFLQSQEYFGADSFIHSLIVRHLDRARFDVHVACSAGPRRAPSASFEALASIPLTNLRRTNFGPSIFALDRRQRVRQLVAGAPAAWDLPLLAGYCRAHHIRIIHCTEKPRDALYGRILARLVGAKLVVHMHVKFHEAITPRASAGILHADHVIAISQFVRESLLAAGVRDDRIAIVHNGLDIEVWGDCEAPPGLREQLGAGPDDPLVLSASRLFVWKGHRELIRAVRLVAGQYPNVRLVVVGEDDPRAHPGGGSFRAELEELVRDLGLGANVSFAGFRRDVPALMQAADIFAMPSFEEPFGMVFLEAMALRRPVVALANGGTLDVVEHGRSGLLSTPGDIDELAANLLTLIRDGDLRKSMGAYGRRRVEEYFNASRLADDVAAVYESILEPVA